MTRAENHLYLGDVSCNLLVGKCGLFEADREGVEASRLIIRSG
jgi:hypothetical protein